MQRSRTKLTTIKRGRVNSFLQGENGANHAVSCNTRLQTKYALTEKKGRSIYFQFLEVIEVNSRFASFFSARGQAMSRQAQPRQL
jgi:hypothetical protein